MPKQVIIPPAPLRRLPPLFRGRSPTEWYMSPALCRSISKTMCSTPATQRRKTRHVLEIIKSVIETAGGQYGGCDLQQYLYHRLAKLRRD